MQSGPEGATVHSFRVPWTQSTLRSLPQVLAHQHLGEDAVSTHCSVSKRVHICVQLLAQMLGAGGKARIIISTWRPVLAAICPECWVQRGSGPWSEGP